MQRALNDSRIDQLKQQVDDSLTRLEENYAGLSTEYQRTNDMTLIQAKYGFAGLTALREFATLFTTLDTTIRAKCNELAPTDS